jgi:hypothetical protein
MNNNLPIVIMLKEFKKNNKIIINIKYFLK